VIYEHVVLEVKPGQEAEYEAALAQALPIIQAADGFRSLNMLRHLEEGPYVLIVGWDSVAAHREGFRNSAPYLEWRALLHHFYVEVPDVQYYRSIAEI
jgi:heme-degrading monooxygenase HmoA